ncbi:hypothetical protein Tco_1265143 [Tanacetum coccineum]
MSNSNINLQTQSSNALHNAIMEAGSKDRPPMLAPGNYVQWKSRIKRYIDTKPNKELIHYCLQNPPYTYQWAEKTVPVAEGSSETTTERYMENYKNVSQDIRDQLNAEAEAVQIILTGIDNDIYSTVDACPNACEILKTSTHNTNIPPPDHKQSTETRKQLLPLSPTYDLEPCSVAEDDEMSKEKEIDKLMALISLSFKKIYKPTNNNLRTSSNTSRANQDNSPRINRGIEEYEHPGHLKLVIENIWGTMVTPISIFDYWIYVMIEIRCSTVSNTPLSSNSFAARTVKFGNDQIAPIIGYADLGNDLLIGSRGTDLYSITLQDSSTPNSNLINGKATSFLKHALWHSSSILI